MRVVKTGRDEPAVRLDHLGAWPAPVAERLVVTPDPRDPVADDRDRVRRPDRSRPEIRPVRIEIARPVRLEDAAADDEQIRRLAHVRDASHGS